jgi:hypothetical protein
MTPKLVQLARTEWFAALFKALRPDLPVPKSVTHLDDGQARVEATFAGTQGAGGLKDPLVSEPFLAG